MSIQVIQSCIRSLLVIGTLLLGATDIRAAVVAGPLVYPANGHTYYLLSQNTWTASEAEAVTLGGHLATINNLPENEWISSNFTALSGFSTPSFWIGLNDFAVEGTFVWTSGEAVGFTYWFSGQPSNTGNEDYASIRDRGQLAGPAGSWNDLPNITGDSIIPMMGVVEVVPEPATGALVAVGALTLFVVRWKTQRRVISNPRM